MRTGTGRVVRAFFRDMFGEVQSGPHRFKPEQGFPGANPNYCCVPDLKEDPTHLCEQGEGDSIHHFAAIDAARAEIPMPNVSVTRPAFASCHAIRG